ncbi:MAG TPA: hypothetical protein VGD88_05245 [Opitutaceae bacterium]
MAKFLVGFLLLVVAIQGVVLSRLWKSLTAADAERTAAEERFRTSRQWRDDEIASLQARLRAAETRAAEFAPPTPAAGQTATGSVLLERNLGSQVAFSYGTPRDAGRYVGQTLRRMFEINRQPDTVELERSIKENELNILSMGPFIKDAEQLESDPAIFAEFQSSLLGEVFAWDETRRAQARELLRSQKAALANQEVGTAAWNTANVQATRQLIALLSAEEQAARQPEIDFITSYGVLIVPTYSILTK